MPQVARANRRRGRSAARRDNLIQIRASAETKAILNQAASIRGQKLSEFMLDSARRQADETLLDQRTFYLDARAHEELLALLDNPVMPSKELRARMNRKPSWTS